MSRKRFQPRGPSPSDGRAWTMEELEDLLSPATHGSRAEDPAPSNPLVQAAAVLSYFNPTTLRPVRDLAGASLSHALQVLVDRSTVVLEGGERRWTLNEDVRRSALRAMGTPEALQRALAANPHPDDSRQRTLELLLSGRPVQVDDLSLPELRELHQVSLWLKGVPGVRLPPPETVRARLACEELLAPFRHLVGDHFRGRRKELDDLRRYAEVVSPEAFKAKLAGTAEMIVRKVLRLEDKPPFFVHGPGGSGKSTLLARFILEHAEAADELRFPFVYLDFDRPGLLGEDPTTLLIEISAQLEAQFPGAGFGAMRHRWNETMIHAARAASHGEDERIFEYSISVSRRQRERWLQEFASVLDALPGPDRPFILVLDTFEEAQYWSQAYVRELWKFLDEFQGALPRMRTVLAGRAPLEKYPVENYPLGEFDQEAALGFLQHLQVDESVAHGLYGQLGGNPLTLKLAAKVARLEDADAAGIKRLPGRRLWFFRVDSARIQGHLYDRILSHIHDPRVRSLAHPGLVLRRITPGVILEVLAEPCGVTVETMEVAEALFAEFSREVSLVSRDPDGSLRHRSEIRKVMLPLIRDAGHEQVEEIHRRAVAFYEKQADLVGRVEEVYHRLWLGESPAVLEDRWDPRLAPYLAAALEELPPAGQAYLAGKLGREVSDQVRAAGDQQTWEADAERRARDLVRVGRIEDARDVLRERKERLPGSRLYVLDATILARLGSPDEALGVVQKGLPTVDAEGSRGTALDLVLLQARLFELMQQHSEAARGYEDVVRMAESRRDARLVWEGGLARLALHHAGLAPEHLDVLALRDRLIATYDQMPAGEYTRYAGLLRSLAGEIVATSPAKSLEIIRWVGVGPLSEGQGRAFFRYLVDAEVPVNDGISFSLDPEIATLLQSKGTRKAKRLEAVRERLSPGSLRRSNTPWTGCAAPGAWSRCSSGPSARRCVPRDCRQTRSPLRAGAAGRTRRRSRPASTTRRPKVARAGRRLMGKTYAALVRQLDHGELLFASLGPPDRQRAPLVESEQRLAFIAGPKFQIHAFYAVSVARGNAGLHADPVRGVRLYPSTGVETVKPAGIDAENVEMILQPAL